MNKKLEKLIYETTDGYSEYELALGFLRYEALRQLNPRKFTALWNKNIKEHTRFDDLVDELVIKNVPVKLWVWSEIYMPEPDNDSGWFEYTATLYNNDKELDSWDSIDSYHSTGRKLTLEKAEKAIEEIKKDVNNGKVNRWFSHPILV